MTLIPVIVNHNGSCGGYHYDKDIPTKLPKEIIDALGNSVKKIEEEVKEEVEKEEKQVKGAINRMIHGSNNKSNKNV